MMKIEIPDTFIDLIADVVEALSLAAGEEKEAAWKGLLDRIIRMDLKRLEHDVGRIPQATIYLERAIDQAKRDRWKRAGTDLWNMILEIFDHLKEHRRPKFPH